MSLLIKNLCILLIVQFSDNFSISKTNGLIYLSVNINFFQLSINFNIILFFYTINYS